MFKGTDIFVYVIAARLERGDAQDLILRKHPGLTVEMIEAARRYVALHPFNRGLDDEPGSAPGFAEDSPQTALTDYPETPEVQVDARVMGGTPCIRGTRVPVYTIKAALDGGDTIERSDGRLCAHHRSANSRCLRLRRTISVRRGPRWPAMAQSQTQPIARSEISYRRKLYRMLLHARLAAIGFADTVHTIHVGLIQKPDHIVFAHAVAYDRIIITKNGKDFRKTRRWHPDPCRLRSSLPTASERHCGPSFLQPSEYLALQPQSADYMVNRILEVSVEGRVDTSMMPPDDISN